MLNKRFLLGLLLLLMVGGSIGGTWFVRWKIQEALDRRAELQLQEQTYQHSSGTNAALIQLYKNTLSSLEAHRVVLPQDQVAFLSAVEQVLTQVGLEKISMTTAGVSAEGRLNVTVQFKGSYYKVAEALAGWRGMSSVVRMSTLSMNMDKSGTVQANTVLETQIHLASGTATGGGS